MIEAIAGRKTGDEKGRRLMKHLVERGGCCHEVGIEGGDDRTDCIHEV